MCCMVGDNSRRLDSGGWLFCSMLAKVLIMELSCGGIVNALYAKQTMPKARPCTPERSINPKDAVCVLVTTLYSRSPLSNLLDVRQRHLSYSNSKLSRTHFLTRFLNSGVFSRHKAAASTFAGDSSFGLDSIEMTERRIVSGVWTGDQRSAADS